MSGKKVDLPDFAEDDDPVHATALAEDLRLGLRLGQKPWLLVVGGRRCVGMLIEIQNKMVIGRAAPSNVILDEEGVSRRHAQVELLPGGVVRVTDLDSSNGVRVAGRRVKFHPLRDGERLRLGDAVLTLVHFDDNKHLLAKNLRASSEALLGK